MKQIFRTFFLIAVPLNGLAQTDTATAYKDLETRKVYLISTEAYSANGGMTYKTNGKRVDKTTYDKYNASWDNMATCQPCILECYDENDVLLRESVSFSDCGVGWFKDYYPNGNLKVTGSYKENPTGNWDNIYYRGYCNVRNGQWTYFSETGDTLYCEYWSDGTFIRQTPEQSDVEIWNVNLLLNGQVMDSLPIPVEAISQLQVNPEYKNSNTDSKLTVEFEVSAVGHKINKKEFTLESFKTIDVNAMLKEVGIPKDKKTTYVLSVYSDGEIVKRFYLDVKR